VSFNLLLTTPGTLIDGDQPATPRVELFILMNYPFVKAMPTQSFPLVALTGLRLFERNYVGHESLPLNTGG
jgi:hypothetical protein